MKIPLRAPSLVKNRLANEIEVLVLQFPCFKLEKGNLDFASAERLAARNHPVNYLKDSGPFQFWKTFAESETQKLFGGDSTCGANRHLVHVRAAELRSAEKCDRCRSRSQQFLDL